MRILYFISVFGYGRGGHNHSLNHISSRLSSKHTVGIISLGPKPSPIIQSNPHFITHIWFNGKNLIALRKALIDNLNSFCPEVLHFFDSRSFVLTTWLVNTNRFKVLLTKCGGPHFKGYPFARNLIVFSREDYELFCDNKKFEEAVITLIPNRVNAVALDSSWKPVAKDSDSFVFVRICRIGKTHRKSLEDSMQLISYLHSRGHRHVKVFIIGVVEDMGVMSTLFERASAIGNNVRFVTDGQITQEASKMLYLADAVIGTGRGFMEAASLGIPVLTLNAEDHFPVLIDEENYADAFRTNFSERNRFKGYDRHRNLEKIEQLVVDKSYAHRLSTLSRQIFVADFDIALAEKRYDECYENAAMGGARRWCNMIVFLKELYRSHLSWKTVLKESETTAAIVG